jgi:hypothetical protein
VRIDVGRHRESRQPAESDRSPGSIQVADTTWSLCHHRYPFTARDVEVKGLGRLRTYLLDPASIEPAVKAWLATVSRPAGTIPASDETAALGELT